MRRTKVLVRAVALSSVAGLAMSAGQAHGSILSWLNLAGGAASTAGNWSPAQVPAAADTLTFGLNSNYTVTFGSPVATSAAHTYKLGTVTLSLTSPNTVSGNWRVGDVSGDAATSTLATGVLTAGSITIGNAAGSTGTVNINDSDADLVTSGTGDIVVGAAGTGTVNVTAGGLLRSADDIVLGSAGGDGTINVSGFSISPLRFSNLQTTAADGDIVVGNSSGTVSTLTVGNSGFVNCADDLQVGLVAGGSGVVNVSGTVSVSGDLQVGNNTTLTTAGSGTVTALSNGVINVTGAIRLGDTTSGSGTLTCREDGEISAHSIICDTNGGFLNLLGGITRVNGGTLTAPNNLLAIDGATGENPILRLQSNATCSLSAPIAPFRAITLGTTKRGILFVDSGSSLTVGSGDVLLGITPGSVGLLDFAGGTTGTFPASRKITVGDSGQGAVTLTSNASVSAGTVELGATATGSGSLSLEGSSTLSLAGPLCIGGTGTLVGGVGEVIVNSGATVFANAASDSVLVWHDGGSLTVNAGGTLKAAGFLRVAGDMTLASGSLDVLALRFDPLPVGRTYDFRGVVVGQVQLVSLAQLNLTGPLTLIESSSSALANLDGTVNVGNNVLSMQGQFGSPFIGNCSIGALGVVNSDRPLSLLAGKVLSGDGTVNAAVTNAGTITATGDGLTFGGIVSGVGQGMSGVRCTFANNGGFTGGGSLNAKIVGQQGSKLTFTANSSAGDGTTTGFTTDGEIDVSFGNLILSDSNGVGLGALTTLRNNSTLTCPSAINLGVTPTLDVLQGQGFVSGTVSCTGVLRPGVLGGDETGQLTLLSSLAFNSGTLKGQLHLDLAGTAAADRDRVTATGPITADGTIEVRLINGFAPPNGFSAAVLSSTASVTGAFVTEILPPKFHVEYGAKDVFVVFCAADFDNDGFITGEDFDQYVAAFEAGDIAADFDGDEFVTGDDFDGFVAAFEPGC